MLRNGSGRVDEPSSAADATMRIPTSEQRQGYAAMAAAAYAKDLLGRIASNKVEAERRICDILSSGQSKFAD